MPMPSNEFSLIEDLVNPIPDLSRPIDELHFIANKFECHLLSEEFAAKLDQSNMYPTHRSKFHIPKKTSEDSEPIECIYLCGHSLGLQPKTTRNKANKVFDNWAQMAVNGHFEGDEPWTKLEEESKPIMASLAGAKTDEIGIMNSLSVNLHLLLISFYQPTKTRFKILMEEKAFPSDHFVVESQIKLHNLDPGKTIECLKPRKDETTLRMEDVEKVLSEKGSQIALVLFSGVHYYTGQFLDIERITRAAHEQGCVVGFDLAHAVGNVELKLHDWNVDFAVWCTYKYLNSGPGGIGAIFLHERHFDNKCMKKLNGWWGNRLETRFQMKHDMDYGKGASAFAISTSPSILLNCLSSSLKLFEEAGIEQLFRKSRLLTAYLEILLNQKLKNLYNFEQITPVNPSDRGSHLSIRFPFNAEYVLDQLKQEGVVCDFRAPDVIRVAPVALYTTFGDVYRFVDILQRCLNDSFSCSVSINII